MKTIGLAACVVLALAACKKNSGGSGSNTQTSGYLASVRIGSPGQLLVDTFSYNPGHHLVRFAEYISGSGVSQADSAFFEFAFTNDTTLPSGYTYRADGITDPHNLYYDANKRIVKDTSLSGTGYVAYYSYPNGNPACTVLFDGTALNNQIDTLYLSGGNISHLKTYFPNDAGTADSLEGNVQYTFGPQANPAYQAGLSESLGHLLYTLSFDTFGGYEDFISKNILQSAVGVGVPGINFTATTDASGRVTELNAAGLPAGTYYMKFTYLP